jgi:cell division protein FtsB
MQAGEIEVVIDWNDFTRSGPGSGGSSGRYYESNVVKYQDCELRLCFWKYLKSDACHLNVGVKVTKLPPSIKNVSFTQNIAVYNGNRRNIIRDDRDSHGAYTYETKPNGSISGTAPYGMGYRCPVRWEDFGSSSRYLRKDGTVHFKLKIQDYKVEQDLASLMRSIASTLKDSVTVRSDTSVIRTQITGLEIENEKLNREKEKIEKEYEDKQVELLNQKSQISKLQDNNSNLEAENESLKQQMEELKKKNTLLEEDVSNCQFIEALKNFTPEKVQWDDNDARTLKEIMTRILQVEGIIQDKITYQESCQRCHKKSMQCVMAPCQHLAYCLDCYNTIDKEYKMAKEKVDLSKEAFAKKTNDAEAKAKEEEDDLIASYHRRMAYEDDDLSPEKDPEPIRCPICTTPVSSVINVQ